MPEIYLHDCVCGASLEWTPLEIEGKYREIFSQAFVCNICGRPSSFIQHEGGNAFVVPRADTELFPVEVREYIIATRRFFAENVRRLHALRRQYENGRFLEVCMHHDARPDLGFAHLPQEVRVSIAVEAGHIFTEREWEHPYTFNPNPFPSSIRQARVSVLAPGNPPHYNPECLYWYTIPS